MAKVKILRPCIQDNLSGVIEEHSRETVTQEVTEAILGRVINPLLHVDLGATLPNLLVDIIDGLGLTVCLI
jgi:hypothetical protein